MALTERIRKVSNTKEFDRLIDDFITSGYTIKSRGETNAHLIKRGKHTHHLLVFLLTFWFTLGLGNLIYALIPAKIEDDVLIKIVEEQNA